MLKTTSGKWLQDKDRKKDFFFSTSADHKGLPFASSGSLQAGNIVSAPASTKVSSPATKTPSNPTAPPPTIHGQAPSAAAGLRMTQEERNRAELPDITKGVPWLPHQAPVVVTTEAWDATAVAMTALTSKWSIPAVLKGTASESDVKVWLILH